jgi:hypothetical protein
MQPDFVLLDDGHKWIEIGQWQQVGPFAGKVVAWRSSRSWTFGSFKIKEDDPTCFGFINPAPELDYYSGYRIWGCLNAPRSLLLVSNPEKWFSMRLLTLAEARHWTQALKTGDITTAHLSESNEDKASKIRLDNLMLSERRKYFRNQVRKTFWPTHRLLWLGRSDSGSAFYGVPKDIVRLLARQVFEAEVDDVVKKAKPDDLLVLE